MDSFTHLVLGAALGELVAGKKIGKKAMLWGAIANTIPDLDVMGGFVFSDANQMMVHRGLTHSFFFAILFSPLLAWFLNRYAKKAKLSMWQWISIVFTALISHDLLDSLTGYGTGWFEPFSHYRVSFNTIFVADPFYTIPFMIFMIIAIVSGRNSERRRRVTIAGLFVSGFYLVFTLANHFYVYNIAEDSLQKNKLEYDHLVVTPTPLNNLLWMAYTHDKLGTRIGYYSLFDKSKRIQFRRLFRNDSLLDSFAGDKDLKYLKILSQGNYIVTKEGNNIYFNDLRFGQMSAWDLSDTNFVFKFNLTGHDLNPRALNRTKYKVPIGQVISSLSERIRGK